MEFKGFSFKLDDGDREVMREQRLVKGYASTFEGAENADCYGDIILPGAFDHTLAEDFQAGRIKFFARHWEPIGMPQVLRVDERGLFIEARISKTTQGNDALELAFDGVLNELSIGFDPIDFDYIMSGGEEIRRLKRIKLYEVSLVPWGANPYARVTDAIKSLGRDIERREGRVLSKGNYELLLKARETLLTARDQIDAVVAAAMPKDEDQKGHGLDRLPLPHFRAPAFADPDEPAKASPEPLISGKAAEAMFEHLKHIQAMLKA